MVKATGRLLLVRVILFVVVCVRVAADLMTRRQDNNKTTTTIIVARGSPPHPTHTCAHGKDKPFGVISFFLLMQFADT